MWSAFAYGAERTMQSAESSGQVNELSTGDAQLDFIVKSEDGIPVAGAEVAFRWTDHGIRNYVPIRPSVGRCIWRTGLADRWTGLPLQGLSF